MEAFHLLLLQSRDVERRQGKVYVLYLAHFIHNGNSKSFTYKRISNYDFFLMVIIKQGIKTVKNKNDNKIQSN